MKNIYSKFIYSLMTCLMALFTMGANAQTWDFNEEGVGSADQENLNADTQNWTYDSTNDRWSNVNAYELATLTANGVDLNFTSGLLFTTSSSDPSGAIRLDNKKKCLTLNKANTTITIKNLTKDDKITVRCKSSSSTTARGLTVTNVTPVSGYFNGTTLESQTNVGTVAEDGDVTFTNDGGIYIYEISIGGDTEVIVPDNYNSVSLNTSKNQIRLTLKNSEIKYYNTDDVTVAIDKAAGTVTVNPISGDWSDVFTQTVSDISFAKAEPSGTEGDVENADGKVEITEAKGWQESAYIKWKPFDNADSYKVYIKGGQYSGWTELDDQLVRDYGTYGRADAVGLKAATDYAMKVVPYNGTTEMASNANEATNMVVVNYSREGFAHKGVTEGVGAYNNDGTLKEGAHVVYVTANTAKTVSLTLSTGTYTGFQDIIYGYQKAKGNDKPLAVRIIGKISDTDMDEFGSSSEGLQVKGNNSYSPMNITIEGIGDDATISGFGILCRNSQSVEFRNFAIMLCMDDCLSLDTDNKNVWIHNMDFFYGQTGGESDQAKGDGTVDIKGDSQYITTSYNRFWDSGKSSLCGMTSESGPNWITYHHNWFDHSDSRHPRIRTMSVHVWNNYYDGVAKYGVGAAKQSNAFVESNYFRGTKYPMLISKQGSDVATDSKGTFSGEDGGMIKSYGNIFAEKPSSFSYVTYQQNNTEFDAYEVTTPDEQVPSTVAAKQGGRTYTNFDTDASLMYEYTPDAAADVPAIVTGFYGAGRLNHGDFTWDFSGKDSDYSVDTALKTALGNYKSSLVKIFGDENASSGETGGSGSGETGGGDEGGETGGDEPDTPVVTDGEIYASFVGGTLASNSTGFFTVAGSKGSSHGSMTINGVNYPTGLKLDSKGSISFTPSKKMTMTVYFNKRTDKDGVVDLKINGEKVEGTPTASGDGYTITMAVASGTTYELLKGTLETCVFYISLVPLSE